jgi:hypothetical protein
MTRLKLVFVKLVIGVGIALIAAWQWNVAMNKNNFGNNTFDQGMVGKVLLGVVMAGIPAILFAVLAYIALEWLLFAPGELADYRAHRRIAGMRHTLRNTSEPSSPTPEKPGHDYAD